MPTSGVATGTDLAVKKWKQDAFENALSMNVLNKYMGTDEMAVIHVNEELQKGQGEKVVFSLSSDLTGQGVQGDSTLEGNEEALTSYAQTVTIDQYRNAVRVAGRMSEKRHAWTFWSKAKPKLTRWKAQFDEDKMFAAMGSVDGVLYSAASTGQKDTHNVNNSDRILYGATTSNYNATHATALGNVDSTTDVLNTAHLSLLKRMAKGARPRISPIKVPNGPASEMYVYFAHQYTTRDLKADQDWQDAQLHAMPRGLDNPLFTGMIGIWDGIIVVETDKIAILSGVGNGTINVAQNIFCGAQALLVAMGGIDGDRLGFVEKEFDYENQMGVAMSSIWGVEKARFGTGAAGVTKDHGIITSYVSGVAD